MDTCFIRLPNSCTTCSGVRWASATRLELTLSVGTRDVVVESRATWSSGLHARTEHTDTIRIAIRVPERVTEASNAEIAPPLGFLHRRHRDKETWRA